MVRCGDIVLILRIAWGRLNGANITKILSVLLSGKYRLTATDPLHRRAVRRRANGLLGEWLNPSVC